MLWKAYNASFGTNIVEQASQTDRQTDKHYLLDRWESLAAIISLSNTFDTLDHKILLYKLLHCGVKCIIIIMVSIYFS